MKKNIKWALLVLLASVCLQSKAQCIPIDTVQLNKAYNALIKSNFAEKEQHEFFNAFPATWDEFVMTYDRMPPYNNLESKSLAHIQAFGKLTAVSQEEYCARLVSLGCNGQWNADAVNILQSVIQDYTMKHLQGMLSFMESSVTPKVAYHFWRFYFASIVDNEEDLKGYAAIREAMSTHPKLSTADFDLAFFSSYGKSTIGYGGGYPHYDKNLEKKASKPARKK